MTAKRLKLEHRMLLVLLLQQKALGDGKGKKVIVFKYKPKIDYRKNKVIDNLIHVLRLLALAEQ